MFPEFFNAAASEVLQEQKTDSYSRFSSGNTVVVSVGGSLFFNDGVFDPESIRRISDSIQSLHSSGYNIVIVVGGGIIARDYIEIARSFNPTNFELDELGIQATRLNAMLLICAMEKAFPDVLTDIKQAGQVIDSGKIPVFGGLIPGVTTDFDAAIIAEYLGATFINLSNVDGIFDSDPKKNPDAKMFRELSYSDLISILIKEETKPRQNLVLDVPAALVLKRSNITAFFLNGRKTENFEAAVKGMSFEGTVVRGGVDSLPAEEIQEGIPPEGETEISKPKRKRKPRKPKKPFNKDDYADKIARGLI